MIDYKKHALEIMRKIWMDIHNGRHPFDMDKWREYMKKIHTTKTFAKKFVEEIQYFI